MKKFICLLLMLTLILSMTTVAYGAQQSYTLNGSYDQIVGSDEKGEIFCARKDGKYGYVDKSGKVLLNFVYDDASEFSEGLAYIEKDGKTAYINTNGKVIIDLSAEKYKDSKNIYYNIENNYFYGNNFNEGYAIIGLDNNRLIIDKTGKVIDYPTDIEILDYSFYDNNIIIYDQEGNRGYYNIKTKKLVTGYRELTGFYNNMAAGIGKDDGLVYTFDQDLTPKCTNIAFNNLDFLEINNKFIQISNYDEYLDGYVGTSLYTPDGKIVFSSSKYLDITSTSSPILLGYMLQENSGLYGIMDYNENVIVEPQFKYLSGYINDYCIASNDYEVVGHEATGHFGVIDKTGKYIIGPIYDGMTIDLDNIYCCKNDKWSIISLGTATSTTSDQPASWAVEEVKKAIENKLVPEELQNHYADNITREDFCKLTISLVEAKLGKSIDQILSDKKLSLDDNPFTDTTSKTIIAANKLNIVNGKGNGIFEPNGQISRQEAAVMLTNVANALGQDTTAQGSSFSDNKDIARWASVAVNYVASKDIMKGTNKGFEPLSQYTRQQAYLTIQRLFSIIK